VTFAEVGPGISHGIRWQRIASRKWGIDAFFEKMGRGTAKEPSLLDPAGFRAGIFGPMRCRFISMAYVAILASR
jgi:hypothetical protein